MRKLYFTTITALLFGHAFSQNVAQITIDNRGQQDIITFIVDE